MKKKKSVRKPSVGFDKKTLMARIAWVRGKVSAVHQWQLFGASDMMGLCADQYWSLGDYVYDRSTMLSIAQMAEGSDLVLWQEEDAGSVRNTFGREAAMFFSHAALALAFSRDHDHDYTKVRDAHYACAMASYRRARKAWSAWEKGEEPSEVLRAVKNVATRTERHAESWAY